MTSELIIGAGVLGRNVKGALRQLDKVPLDASITRITFISDEIFSHCPVTGQPDFYTAEIIVFKPKYSIESKSLKLYLQSFEDPGDAQFCEKFADTICQDVARATEAGYTSVTLKQKSRGGISIHAVSEVGEEG